MSKSGGGGSTTRHIIEVMYQVTGLDKAGAGITSMNKSVTQGQTTLDKYGMSATKASTETTKLATSTSKIAPVMDKTSMSASKLDKSQTSASSSAKSLGEKFRGNKGLIFSTTMLSSGVFEAIGMFQGWTDASEKLATAQAKVADLEARGMENTKEYGDAVREAADAQRGFNFIQRFTIQSFADLIPMSLMMASSLIEMSGNFMKGATAKEKFAAVSGKVVSGIKAIGSAMVQFTTRHPLLLLLTLLSAAIVAVITNFGGFRDRLNEVGVALGNAVPGLQGVLTWLGNLGGGFVQSAEATMGYSQTTTKSLKDVEAEVLRTGDATTLSIDEQIAMYGKLGDEAKNVAFSLGMHLKMQQDDQAEHEKKYAAFVSAMKSGDTDIINSMGLTEDEFKEFYKQWEAEIQAFETSFSAHVDNVVENYKKFGEEARASQEEQGSELAKLEQKLSDHYAKREEIRDGEGKDQDEAMAKWEEEKNAILEDIAAVNEGLSQMAIDARDDWNAFSDSGKEAMEQFRLEAVGGNFQDAITTINTAMDNVPAKYKQNMGMARSILDNESLTMETRADLFVANIDKLNPFQSFIVGAHEYTLAQAQVTSGLDEMAVAARAHVTDMDQMPTAWDNFVASLSPAQKALPVVKSNIEGVNKGAITAATAFANVEAAGRLMSAALGGTVTQSFEDLQKTIVTMPDGTKQAFASIGGQVVSLGDVSSNSLVKGPNSVVKSMDVAASETDYLASAIELNIGTKAPASVQGFQTDANSFINGIISTFQLLGTEVAKIPGILKTNLSTDSIKTAWDGFRNSLGETGTWINTGVQKIAGYIKGAITLDNFKDAWTGFWQAIAEGKDVILSGITTIATTIASDIKAKAMSQKWWAGFWDALGSTAQWLGTGINAIGTGIISTISTQGPNWWKGFRDALASTAQWVGTGIKAIGTGIISTITTQSPNWWKGFRDALASTAQWVGTGIKAIGTGIISTISSQGPNWWVGFRNALASTAQWLGTGITKIGEGIIKTIQGQGPNWWVGFRDALASTAQWVGTGIKAIGAGILKTISTQGPTWWTGFRDALASTAQWIGKGIKAIGEGIMKTMTPANSIKWWTGFQQALGSTAQWLGKGILAIGKGITSEISSKALGWWKGFRDALANVTWVTNTIGKIGKAITGFDWAGVGADIWGKITGAFGALAKGAGDIFNKIKDFIMGGAQEASGQEDKGMGNLEKASQMVGGNMDEKAVKALHAAWSSFSTSMATYSKSIVTSVTAIQKTISTLSTSVSTYATSMTTNIGTFFTKVGAAIPMLDGMIKTHQGTWSAFSTSILAYATSMTTNLGAFFTKIAQALQLLDPALKQHHASWAAFSTSLTTYASSMTTNLGNFFTKIAQALTLLDQGVKLHQASWSAFSTSLTTYAGSMTTNLGKFFTTTSTGLMTLNATVKTSQGAWSTLSTSIATYSTSMSNNVNKFSSTTKTAMTGVANSAKTAQTQLSNMSKSVSTYMSSMSSAVSRFGSAASSSFSKVGSQAAAATSKVKQLASAINSLKSKSINIHVGLSGPGARFMRHGGAFISEEPTGFAAEGKSWINSKPRKIGGVNISEFGKPELVTVTPLSDPGNPMDKSMNLGMNVPKPQAMPSALGANPFNKGGQGGTGGQPITVTGNLNVIVKTQNGKVLAQEVQPYLFEGFSGVT